MNEEKKILIGSWIDAIGTDLVALGEMRELVGINTINNKIVAIGEALEALGTFLIGSGVADDPINFTGNLVDGFGAATAMAGNYKQYLDPENGDESISYEILGDILQAVGAAVAAKAEKKSGQLVQTLGNVLQSLGAGLEAFGAYLLLNDEEELGQWIVAKGAVIQSLGSNIFALIATKDYFVEEEEAD